MNSDRSKVKEKTNLPFKKQITVMLVEDSEADRAVYRRYLERDKEHDYSFIEAETGESALEIYEFSEVDIVLLDYLLPDMDGLKWFDIWQAEHRDSPCPVIVLTGQGNENIAVQFIKQGAVDYLVKKEITAEKLKLSIEKALSNQQLQLQNQQLIERLIERNQQLTRSNQMCEIEITRTGRLKQIIDNIPLVVYAKKVEPTGINSQEFRSGKMWLLNKEFQRVFGVSEAETIGKSDREIFSSNTVDRFEVNDLFVIENKKSLIAEEQVYHADGQLQTYLSIKIPLLNENQEVDSIIGIASNITQEKQAEARLNRLENRFRNTFEQAAVGMAHVALNGKWLMVNQKLCDIVGYTKTELLAKTFQNITHPDDLTIDLEYLARILAGEIATYSLEKRYIRKDNSSVWINLTVSLAKNKNGEPEHFISVIEDISKRKNLELERQKTLKRLSNLLEINKAIIEASHPQAIAKIAVDRIRQLLSCQRVSIVTFNFKSQTARVLLAKGEAELKAGNGFETKLDVWQSLIDSLEKEEVDYVVACTNQISQLLVAIPVLADSKLNCFVCFPLKTQGKWLGILKIWLEDVNAITPETLIAVKEISTLVAIALQQANLTRAIQDYTLELEDKVKERTAQLEEINQELKSFSYSISHDLKAPLRAIQGFATALQEDYGEKLDELGHEYTVRLSASAQQMERLIQDLLAYSRLSHAEIQKRKVNLTSIVDEAIEQLNLEIVKAEAEITVEKPLSSMLGNQTILQQVINNLMSNAVKFVANNVKPQIHIWTEQHEDYVRLWIEDNGIGIEPQYRERIFQVFERLHGNEAYPGTGIGLAIVRKGIERLNGRFGVESEKNRFSRFWIELPAYN